MVECRLAAMVLAVALGQPVCDAGNITTLKEVEPFIIAKYGPGAEAQDKAVRELLHEGVYMPDEVCHRFSLYMVLCQGCKRQLPSSSEQHPAAV